MALTAGALSLVYLGDTNADLLSAAATMGTAPYTYQWYQSTTTGFTPGGGNILAGKTTLAISVSGLASGTTYYYKVVATDSASPAATATSNQLEVTTPMSLTAGALSLVNVTNQTISLSSAAATMGTAPYTYQWYESTTTGFTPGAGNLVSGATSLTLTRTGLIPATTYYYKVIATDSASPAATSTATQLAVTTQPAQNQNQFSQTTILGMVDLPYSYATVGALIDATQATTLYAGAAVKLVASTTGGVPSVIGCSANSDAVFGFINYNVKNPGFVAGNAVEISQAGNVMYLYATGAITQGAQLQLDVAANGGVAASVGSSGADYVGWAFDGAAAAGAIIRVHLTVPSFKTF